MPNYGLFHLRARAAAVAMVARKGGADHWTSFQYTKAKQETAFQKIGFNFGAPGDRYDENGTLWMKAFRGGDFKIKLEPREATYFTGGSASDWIKGSGVTGATQIGVPTALNQKSNNSKSIQDIRLHFPEQGGGVFDIVVEGQTLKKDFDLSSTNGRESVLNLENVAVQGRLDIELIPKSGQPTLSGIELQRVN